MATLPGSERHPNWRAFGQKYASEEFCSCGASTCHCTFGSAGPEASINVTIFSGDMIMGGVRNVIEVYTSGGSLFANITPNNHLMSYLTNEEKLANVYITEKVDRKTGWQFLCLEEEWTRGYLQEIQDFMECVVHGRQPRADLDLARGTMKIQYAGYWSAEEGRRIAL